MASTKGRCWFETSSNERNTRWEYIPPGEVVKKFDERRETVRAIMNKAGIIKDAK